MDVNFKSENGLAVACLENNSKFRWLMIKVSETNRVIFSNIANFKTSN